MNSLRGKSKQAYCSLRNKPYFMHQAPILTYYLQKPTLMKIRSGEYFTGGQSVVSQMMKLSAHPQVQKY